MKPKTKKEIHIIINGLNQFGLDEMNKYYQLNFELGYLSKDNWFKLGQTFGMSSKRIKQIKSFDKECCYLGYYNVDQALPNDKRSYPFRFMLQHFDHEIYEVEITETYTRLS